MKTKKMIVGGLFCALGVLLPQIFHLFGTAGGSAFLPMHIPTLVAGFLLGPAYGTVVGALSPVLSSFFTGMPPMAKMPFMIFELAAYGFTSGLLSKKLPPMRSAYLRTLICLIAAQLVGRIVNVLCTLVALHILGIGGQAVTWMTVWTSVLTGAPGIAVQIVLIPPLVLLCKKTVSL